MTDQNPQTKWVTIAKSDPRFRDYLENRLPHGEKAIPVKTYRPLSQAESVTFKVVRTSGPGVSGGNPGPNGSANQGAPRLEKFFLLIRALRFRDWSFFLTPIVWTVFYLSGQSIFWDPWLALCCLQGVLFLNLSAFFMNDSVDFESGADRITDREPTPLSQGLIGLALTRKLSWSLLILGGLAGLPSVWVFPQILIWVGLPAFLALWFWCRPSYFFKRSLFAELMVSGLYGLGLVVGFSLGVSGHIDTSLLLMGLVFSLLFLVVISARNFERLMAERFLSPLNFVHRLGFDRARSYLLILWGLSGGALLSWQSLFGAFFWLVIFALHYFVIGMILWRLSLQVMSPLGSRKRNLARTYRGAVFSVYLLIILQIAVLGI